MSFSTLIMKGMADVIVLRVLDKNGECYGYELIEKIGEQSKDMFAFREGTLYPLLYRLEKQEFVTSKRRMALNGKERRYYKITETGQKYLNEQSKEYQGFMQGLRSVFDWSQV